MKKTDKNYCFQKNDDFLPLKEKGIVAVIRKQDDCPELRDCIKNPEEYLNKAEIFKDSRTTKAGIVTLNNNKEVFIKRFNRKSFTYTLKYIFREARPFRVWRSAWAFANAGIPTPKPMAALADYKYGIPGNAYLIRNVVPEIVSTLDFFAELKNNKKLSNAYLDAIAAMILKMHNSGIYHGDAKCSNIYVESLGKDQYSYGLWDLLSCRVFQNTVSNTLRQKELSHIAWSFAEISNRDGVTIDENDVKKQLQEKYNGAMQKSEDSL